MTLRELQELRAALERLRDALTAAVRAMDEAEQAVPDKSNAYDELGAPFGSQPAGHRIWHLFGQYTTRN